MADQDFASDDGLLESLSLDGDNEPELEQNSMLSWEDDIKFHCDQIVSKICRKEVELKLLQRDIEIAKADTNKEIQEKRQRLSVYKQSLEEEHQRKRKDLDERRLELDTLKADLEEAYLKKVEAFDDEKNKMNKLHEIQEGKIKLDVGGNIFTTSKATVCRDQDSMFAIMFSGRHSNVKSEDGSYFIDRDGTYFRYILNYLRGVISIPSDLPEDVSTLRELRGEADFYQLAGLTELINEALDMPSEKVDFTQEEITEMMSTLVRGDEDSISGVNSSSMPTNSYCTDAQNSSEDNSIGRAHFVSQNMTKTKLNFTNKKLNGISFAHTTFFHSVSFRNACLVGSSFYGCEFGVGVKVNFNYADLSDCDFRQCKGKEAGSNLNFGHGGGLVSGSSSDTFLQMVEQGRITFKKAKIEGALFDSKVFRYLNGD